MLFLPSNTSSFMALIMGYTGRMRSQYPPGPRGGHRASVFVPRTKGVLAELAVCELVFRAVVGLVARVANRPAEGGILRTGILSGATSAGRFHITCAGLTVGRCE